MATTERWASDAADADWGWGEADQGTIGFGRELTTTKSDPEPPKDKRGETLTSEDVRRAIGNLDETRLRLDKIVGDIEHPEKQALRAVELAERWKDRRKDLERKLKKAEEYERWVARQSGIVSFGMDDDEGNEAVTAIVDEEADWYHAEIDALKDRAADRVRSRLDTLVANGKPVSVEVRDSIYEALVEKEVIEIWEPLEI